MWAMNFLFWRFMLPKVTLKSEKPFKSNFRRTSSVDTELRITYINRD